MTAKPKPKVWSPEDGPFIASAWAEFETQILDPMGAGPIQRQEMRRAFYGGVANLMSLLAAIGDSEVSEDQGEALLEGIVDELEVFMDSMEEGKAF